MWSLPLCGLRDAGFSAAVNKSGPHRGCDHAKASRRRCREEGNAPGRGPRAAPPIDAVRHHPPRLRQTFPELADTFPFTAAAKAEASAAEAF